MITDTIIFATKKATCFITLKNICYVCCFLDITLIMGKDNNIYLNNLTHNLQKFRAILAFILHQDASTMI